MSLTQHQVTNFYDGCDYWTARRHPYRPRELHFPKLLSGQGNEFIESIRASANNGSATYTIDQDDCKGIAPVLLHESLFHFYKAFYNYLAARSLYFGGFLHWINITLYYSQFYIARSVTTLLGKSSYRVNRSQHEREFVQDIANCLASSKGKAPDAYRIRLDLDTANKSGTIIFDKKEVSSHRDVWKDYQNIPVEEIGLYPVTYKPDTIVQERNEENYSFEGYTQLDFNLSPSSFTQYFERDYTKSVADTVFDFDSLGVLLAFSSQLALYRTFNIANIPIESDKFAYMINYCLPDSPAKEKLLMLCSEGFPTRSLNTSDGDVWFDEQGRCL